MNSPELSIVVPAFNEADHLESVINEMASVLDASGIAYEIRVVNNGSTDGSAVVLEKLKILNPRIVPLHLKKNQHYGGGILAGLEGATGSVIGWADADGQVDPRDIV